MHWLHYDLNTVSTARRFRARPSLGHNRESYKRNNSILALDMLVLMFKILNGHVAIPPEKYFCKSTRNTRCQHSQKIIQATALSDYHAATFFIPVDTITRWNEAPAGLVEAVSLDVFRGELLAKITTALNARLFLPVFSEVI